MNQKLGEDIDGMFYDENKTLIKTVHFGATSYADFTINPHDDGTQTSFKHTTDRESWHDYAST